MIALVALAGLVPAMVMWTVAPPQRRRARTWWLAGLLAAAIALLIPREPWLAVAVVALAYYWAHEPNDLAGRLGALELFPVLFAWLAIGTTWCLVRMIPEAHEPWLIGIWAVIGAGHAALMVMERLDPGHTRAPHGGAGQRMYAGAFLAMLCLLMPLIVWPILLVGIFLSGPSWLALVALAVGASVRWPLAAPFLALSGLCITAAIWRASGGAVWPFSRFPRGDTTDTIIARLHIYRLAIKHLVAAPWSVWLVGFGPGTSARASRRWGLRYRFTNRLGKLQAVEAIGNFHSEPLQLVFEFGALGALGLALFLGRVGSGLMLGDPWSAAAAAGMVLALGSNISGIIPIGVTFLIICARVAP